MKEKIRTNNINDVVEKIMQLKPYEKYFRIGLKNNLVVLAEVYEDDDNDFVVNLELQRKNTKMILKSIECDQKNMAAIEDAFINLLDLARKTKRLGFYVNEISEPWEDDKYIIQKKYLPKLDISKRCIGLFKECEWDGEGNFCGWYAREYYKNTVLYAYYVKDEKGKRIGDIVVLDKPIAYEKLYTVSDMGCTRMEANTIEEAIEYFQNNV